MSQESCGLSAGSGLEVNHNPGERHSRTPKYSAAGRCGRQWWWEDSPYQLLFLSKTEHPVRTEEGGTRGRESVMQRRVWTSSCPPSMKRSTKASGSPRAKRQWPAMVD